MADNAGENGIPDPSGEIVDQATFSQILEMDDDEDEREFSKSIVYDFFEQAQNTFDNMDKAIEKGDLEDLSSLGHFLKGSSATLGLSKLKDSCEKIQHFGARKDEAGTTVDWPDSKFLEKTKGSVGQAKTEFEEAEALLKRFYHDE